jgi:transglutaminase-like putative cysteine protease
MTRILRLFLVVIGLAGVSAAWFFQARPAETDSDGDGLSDYAELHKYFTDPHKATPAEQRKEFTYTITSVLQIAKPFNAADMNDDYQDARVLSEEGDSATVEFVYYPLNTNKYAIGENPNWKRDYAHMTQYLRPTATENWDEKMRADLIAELAKEGIDPDRLTDKQLVTEVSRWLMRRSRSTKAFAIWYVHYPGGRPEVFPSLRKPFDREKPAPDWTDQAMFDQELLGRSMFYNRIHGSCTSSSAYIATVMRALGIPTRIVFCIPPLDANDRQQREMLLSSIHHNRVRATIRHGLPDGHGDFSNHLFNEVFVGGRWVRLNYDTLGQNILDDRYYGLLTHILTTDSISSVPLHETWGRRYAAYPDVTPKLSSINPYRLLKVSDHFGGYSRIPNPEVDDEELRKVTVIETYWKGALPPAIQERHSKDPTGSDFYIGIAEFIPRFRLQLRDFARQAGSHFVLTAPGHPELKATLSLMKITDRDPKGRPYQLFGVRVDPEYRHLLAPGVDYTIQPINTSETYTWTVKDGVVLRAPAPL